MSLMNWKKTDLVLPENDVIVWTKVDDERGERNTQQLKRSGRLWFVPDGSMYIYYTPTHWHP